MKKFVLLTALIVIVLFNYSLAHAEDTLPPLPIPVLDESVVPEASVVASVEPSPIISPSPVVKKSVVVQDFTSGAETGSKLYVLLAVSALGGLGLFSIKKYFDSKKYSI